MRAYIVSSPYQILNSLQLSYPFEQKKADIYIINQFKGAGDMAENLKDSRVFSRVILVDDLTRQKRSSVQDFWDRNVGYVSKVKKYIEDVYEEVYFAAMEMTVYMLLMFMKKQNHSLHLIQMEDGLGDYIGGNKFLCSGRDILFSKITGSMLPFDEASAVAIRNSRYVYEPKLLIDGEQYDNLHVLPNHFAQGDFLKKVNEIYQFDSVNVPPYKILLVDTAITNGSDAVFDEILLNVVEFSRKYFQKKNIGVKLHPRRVKDIYGNMNQWGRQNVPMEIIFSNMRGDLSEKILIGIISTTSITPKIIFDEEPVIISLHKMAYNCKCIQQEFLTSYTGVFEKLKKLYRAEHKIFSPETAEELDIILKSLAE